MSTGAPTLPVVDAQDVELLVDPGQAGFQALDHHGLEVGGGGRVEQGAKAFVQFRADEVQPGLQLVARQRAVGRGQVLFGHLVGDVLHDGRTFGEHLTIRQF